MKNIFLFTTLLALAVPQGSFGGGIGGGGVPPRVSTDERTLIELKDAALEGKLIRYKTPGSEPIYLQPDIASIREYGLTAVEIGSGNTAVFYAETDTEAFQRKVSRNLARTAGSIIPGTLPISEEDMMLKMQPQIESVPANLSDAKSATNDHPID